MKLLLFVLALVHFLACVCATVSTSSAEKVSSSPYTQMRDDRRKIGQARKMRNFRNAKYFRNKIIPLEDKDQQHRENYEWDYNDHDPLPHNLDVHRGEGEGCCLSKTLLHKVKHTINNWADKLSKLQHDTRMRASQPQITERSFQRPYAVKEEDSGLAMTHGEE